MTIKEKLERVKNLMDWLASAYDDDKTTGEYLQANEASRLIKEILKTIG